MMEKGQVLNSSAGVETRRKVLKEILDTEQAYVSSLDTLHEIYYIPLATAAADTSKQILSRRKVEILFSNINIIANLNRRLLGVLQERIRNEPVNARLGDVFMDFAHFFKMYTTYVNNYEEASKLLNKAMNSSERARKFFETTSSHPKCNGLGIDAFLIMPIQRIPRYQLLLQMLLRCTAKGHVDHSELRVALDSVTGAAARINGAVKERENMEAMVRIQRLCGDSVELLSPSRVYLLEEELMKQCRRQDKPFTFFLFNDMLMYGAQRLKGYKLSRVIPIDHSFNVKDLPDNVGKSQYRFQIISAEKSFVVHTRVRENKQKWVNTLRECIEQFRNNINGKSAEQKETKAHTAPVWVSDRESISCLLCGSAFTLVKRRHHCRSCGKLVCGACSKHRTVFGKTTSKQRVCDECAPKFGLSSVVRSPRQSNASRAVFARVVRTFIPLERTEFELQYGEELEIVDHSNSEWWIGVRDGEQGKVKASCVQLIVGEAADEDVAVAIGDHDAEDESEVSVSKGDVLMIAQAHGRFWYVRNTRTDKSGFVDVRFVKRRQQNGSTLAKDGFSERSTSFDDASVSVRNRGSSEEGVDSSGAAAQGTIQGQWGKVGKMAVLGKQLSSSYLSKSMSASAQSSCGSCSKCPQFSAHETNVNLCVNCGHSRKRHC